MEKQHDHTYGPGYFDLVNGTRVKHTQVCSGCGDVLETKLDNKPSKKKPQGPSISGMDSVTGNESWGRK